MRKSMKGVISLIGVGLLICLAGRWQQKCIDCWKEESRKQRAMFLLMNQWVNLKQDKRNLAEYFQKNGYQKIAIYGMGPIGLQLVRELKNSSVDVSYGIDQNSDSIFASIRVVKMNDELASVDAVVVTVIKEFDAIREDLLEKLTCPIIAIEDVLNEF